MTDTRRRWRDHLATVADAVVGIEPLVVGVAASFTSQPLEPYIGTALLDAGFAHPRVVFADFNQIHQVCLDPTQVFGGGVDRLVLLWRIEDVFEADFIAGASGDADATARVIDGAAELMSLVVQCARRDGLPTVVSIPPTPYGFATDRLDPSSSIDIGRLHEQVLRVVIDRLEPVDGVRLVDHRRVVEELGARSAHDLRGSLLYRQPYRTALVELLGDAVGRTVASFDRVPPKVIVLDCDDTLWGGTVGEDGADGVEIGATFPGNAFQMFQLELRRLARRGVLLAICSKNDAEDVDEVFRTRPEMALRVDDIASWRVNWLPKSANIAAIAHELNLDLDSFVFIDNSDFELAEVAAAHPQVRCLRVPDDIEDLPELLAETGLFRSIRLSNEDRERTQMIRQERERQTIQAEISTEDFLASLGLRVEFGRVDYEQVARVTQLVNKTNQFNLTTRRRTEVEIAELVGSQNHAVYAIRVADRFGSYGLVGVSIVDVSRSAEWEIDTLLMSCRVLRRGVESAFLAALAAEAQSAGAARLVGRFESSAKNAQVAGLYPDHGFDSVGPGVFALDLSDPVRAPEHIELVTDA